MPNKMAAFWYAANRWHVMNKILLFIEFYEFPNYYTTTELSEM